MSNVQEILAAEFEALRSEIVAAYRVSGVNASGNWQENLKVQVQGEGASITAPDYINGRKPGTPPPSEAIEQWIKDKGIAARLDEDMSTGSLAYLIARKIGREGWQPKQENIINAIATPRRIQQILDKAGNSCREKFSSEIINYLQTITA